MECRLRVFILLCIVCAIASDDSSVRDLGVFQEHLVGCGLDGQPSCPRQPDSKIWEKSKDGTITKIYYMKSLDLPDEISSLVDEALESEGFVVKTCISFVGNSANNKNPRHTLSFESGPLCAAEIPKNNKHRIFLSSNCVGSDASLIIRLLLLSLGFPHEINRNDRENYIKIIMKNVLPGQESQLQKDPDDVTYSNPYDVLSLLHPGPFFLSGPDHKPTLVALEGDLGNNTKFSATDLENINKAFCKDSPAHQGSTVAMPNGNSVAETTPSIAAVPEKTFSATPALPAVTTSGPDDVPVQPVDIATTSIKPTLTKRCPGMVTLNNTQLMSVTTIFPERTKLKTMTRWSKWWFHIKPEELTKNMLHEEVDYTEFKGPINAISTVRVDSTFLKLQTEYKPEILAAEEATIYRSKSETRILECDETDTA